MRRAIIGLLYCLAMVCLLSGCVDSPDRPRPIRFVTPSYLNFRIASADHIVVTNRRAGQLGAPKYASFSLTLTGHEMKRITYALASLRLPIEELEPGARSHAPYEWQLQFYRGSALLAAANFSGDFVFCEDIVDGEDYPAPWALRRLYHRVKKESGEQD